MREAQGIEKYADIIKQNSQFLEKKEFKFLLIDE